MHENGRSQFLSVDFKPLVGVRVDAEVFFHFSIVLNRRRINGTKTGRVVDTVEGGGGEEEDADALTTWQSSFPGCFASSAGSSLKVSVEEDILYIQRNCSSQLLSRIRKDAKGAFFCRRRRKPINDGGAERLINTLSLSTMPPKKKGPGRPPKKKTTTTTTTPKKKTSTPEPPSSPITTNEEKKKTNTWGNASKWNTAPEEQNDGTSGRLSPRNRTKISPWCFTSSTSSSGSSISRN